MINQAVKLFLVAVLMLIPCNAFALPGAHDPLTGGNGYTCNSCHWPGKTTGKSDLTYDKNICLTCHMDSAETSKLFPVDDFANPYKNTAAALVALQSSTPRATSHKWFGSDTVPAAGAQPPVDTRAGGLNKTGFAGYISCARCHSVHGTSGENSVQKPYLRMANDQDQMCLNCHRSRDTKDHKLGSHPVNITYTSATAKAKIASGSLLATPVVNAANPTGQVKLVNGKVVCSTCHGVHGSDSRSSTFDILSSTGFSRLSSSKGYLLRVDARGIMSADGTTFTPNICTNCHIGINHSTGNKKANVQCDDCHSGHVEYIPPADVAAGEGTPNVYLLRRYVNYSGGVKLTGPNEYRRKVFFLTTSSQTTILIRPDGKGICQGCHTPPAIVPEHATATVASECASCHSGGVASISAISHRAVPPAGCTGCHGSPPQVNTAGGPNGYANDIATGHNYAGAKDESLIGHKSHSANLPYNYSCEQCHQGYSHDTGTFADVFINKAGLKASLNGSVPAYVSTGNGTCSTVYCHSNGNPSNMKYKAVNWGLARSTYAIVGTANECIACHNGVQLPSGFNTMSTNSHFKHVSNNLVTGKGIACAACHAATVSSNTTVSNKANHVNGTRDVSFGAGLENGTSWGGSTCSTSYCHSNGRGVFANATWTSRPTGACGTCHAATSPLIATNAHFTHISTATANPWGPDLSGIDTVLCAKCHTYTGELGTGHVNGTVDAPGSTCTASCHRNASPTWTSAARLACETCHDGSVSYDTRAGFNNISAPRKIMTTFTTKGHGQYNAYYCTQCHDNTSKHISGKRNDTNRLINGYDANENNLCFSCHNNVTIVTNTARQNLPTHVLDKNATPTPGLCSACHDTHGTNNYASVVARIIYKASSSAVVITKPTSAAGFIDTTTRRGLCQVCHTITNHYRRSAAEPVNGFNGTGTDHSTFTGTECLSCHKHTGAYAFYPSGGACNGCHGYPPVPKSTVIGAGNYPNAKFEDYSGAGGSHIVSGHIPKNADPAKNWVLCNSCHDSNDHNMGGDFTKASQIKVTVSSRLRFKSAVMPTYTSNRLNGASHLVGNCSNVSCHFQSSPKWGNKP